MSTTAPITIAQVRKAIINSKCDVPDFTTREKATLVWSKVYIAIDGHKLRFVELNFLQRIFRYIAGCTFYSDTIFQDKGTLDRVKEYVHGIKEKTAYHDPIAMDLMPLVKTTSDQDCLSLMLQVCLDNAPAERANTDINDDIYALMGEARNLRCVEGGFSKEFLSAAINFAREKLKKDPQDRMWQSIARALNTSTNKTEAIINGALLLEIMGLGSHMSIEGIKVPDGIIALFRAEMESVNTKLQLPETLNQLRECLRLIGKWEKIKSELNNFQGVIRSSLATPDGQTMVQQLRENLKAKLAHEVLVDAYLNDDAQIAGRLYCHALLQNFNIRNDLNTCLKAIDEKMQIFRIRATRAMNGKYEVVDTGFCSSSFAASCKLLGLTDDNLTSQIVDLFGTDSHYRDLIETRLMKDISLMASGYEEYCEGIRFHSIQVGPPELAALSKITGRPVLVVDKGANFEWTDGYNLDSDQEPLIFTFDGGSWSPVVKIK